ncbi:MAG: hypothetical protein AAGE18_05825 [Pseudomonadota bacterium]
MRGSVNALLGGLGLCLSACGSTNEAAPLVFGQAVNAGIVVAQSATSQNPELTVGLRMADIAVVPTIVPGSIGVAGDDPGGAARKIYATGSDDGESGPPQDALSTFGSFSGDTSTGQVQLGVFFATGVAAQRLSEGFRCGVGQGRPSDCVASE